MTSRVLANIGRRYIGKSIEECLSITISSLDVQPLMSPVDHPVELPRGRERASPETARSADPQSAAPLFHV
eukprot:1178174-Prorocentrum_minimum.AAC.5